jgi:hemoglobin
MTDLTTPEHVVALVDAFYERARADEMLGPIFDDVARVDWDAHLPEMYAFWESVLFGTPGFKGNPLAVHAELAQRVPLTDRAFGRWLGLFDASVASLFSGPGADLARTRAARIAAVMQHHLLVSQPG